MCICDIHFFSLSISLSHRIRVQTTEIAFMSDIYTHTVKRRRKKKWHKEVATFAKCMHCECYDIDKTLTCTDFSAFNIAVVHFRHDKTFIFSYIFGAFCIQPHTLHFPKIIL